MLIRRIACLLFCMVSLCDLDVANGEHLEANDFEDLNRLLEGAVVRLPDTQVASDLVVLYLRNIRCTDFQVEKVALDADKIQRSELDTIESTSVELTIEGLDMVCYLDWTYTFLFTRDGSADVYSYNNRASFEMKFLQMLLDPPVTSVSVEQCSPTVNVDDLDFYGDISALVFDSVERLMRNKIEAEVEKKICQELNALSTTLVTDMLRQVDETLASFLNVDMNPLHSEEELIMSSTPGLLDLRDDSKAASKWLDQILALFVDFATQTVTDVEGNADMRVNAFIRDSFLLDGALVFQSPFDLFQEHNRFIDTKVVVERVQILGLDKLQSFEPFLEIGWYTIQNKLSWGLVTVELDVSIDIRASSKEDSVFESPNTAGTQETVKITFGLHQVELLFSILLAFDEAKIGALRLGSLLYSDNIVDCLLSTFHRAAHVSGLSLAIGNVQPPVMSGFVARGIDRVVSDFVDGFFVVYEPAVLQAAPGFFNSVARNFINEIFSEHLQIDVSCFLPQKFGGSSDGLTDFRDLLLPPDQALALGGMGTQPYGDLVHTLMSQFKGRFLADGDDGTPRANQFIREALERRSPTGESVVMLGDVLNWNTTVVAAGLKALIAVKISDARIGSLDSFGSPLQLLDPVSGEPNMLNSSLPFGIGNRPVRFTARVRLTATDYDGLQLNNELAVRLDLGNAHVMALLHLKVLEDSLFSVPVEDTWSIHCWLITLFPDVKEVDSAVFTKESFSLDQLLVNISCVSCTSPEFSDLIYGLYSPNEIGNATAKFLNLLSLLRESDFLRVTTGTVLEGASRQCPHHPNYDPLFSYSSLLVESGGGGFRQDYAIRDNRVVYFNVVAALVSASMLLIFFGTRTVARRRYQAWKSSLTDEALARLLEREQGELRRNKLLDSHTKSLFRSRALPGHIRLLVPAAIICTIGIQLISHTAILSYVDIEGKIAGESFVIRKFLVFRFIEASVRSYRNGGSEMAILLFVFTGVWPYIKLATCLALWFLPPGQVSVATRGVVLLWLDIFAKLSMVDIVTTLLTVAAVLIYVGGVAGRELPAGEFFTTRIIVVPCVGFYCIVIAQRLTRISSTYLRQWHDHLIACTDTLKPSLPGASFPTCQDFSTVSLSHHISDTFQDDEVQMDFCIPQEDGWARQELDRKATILARKDCPHRHRKGIDHIDKEQSAIDVFKKWRWYRLAIGMTGGTVLSLAVIGMSLAPSVSVDASTLWGLFESGRTFAQAVSDYPIFRMICSILVQARFVLNSPSAKAGLGILLSLAVLCSAAFPVLKLVEWIRRRRQRRQQIKSTESLYEEILLHAPCFCRSMRTLRKILPRAFRKCWNWCLEQPYYTNGEGSSDLDLLPAYRMKAWRHLHVFVFALLVAIWQLLAVTSYIITMYCRVLTMSFDGLVFLGLVEDVSTTCFRVQASAPSTLLVIASALMVLVSSFFVEAVGQFRSVVAKGREELEET